MSDTTTVARPTAELLALLLTAEGVVDYRPDEPGGDTFLGELPLEPVEALAFVAAPGWPGELAHHGDVESVQVVARSERYVAAEEAVRRVYAALHGRHSQDLEDDVWLVDCRAVQSSPQWMGRSEAGTHMFSLNFDVQVERPTPYRIGGSSS